MEAIETCKNNDIFRIGDDVFVWGIKSGDDLTGNNTPACMYTMNDIDLTYNVSNKLYALGIETIYYFDQPANEMKYYRRLLEMFTAWMVENGYDTNAAVEACCVFNGDRIFPSIPQAYAWFKLMVESCRALHLNNMNNI